MRDVLTEKVPSILDTQTTCPSCGGKGYRRIGNDHDDADCTRCHKSGRVSLKSLAQREAQARQPYADNTATEVTVPGHERLLSFAEIAKALRTHAAIAFTNENDDVAQTLRRAASSLERMNTDKPKPKPMTSHDV